MAEKNFKRIAMVSTHGYFDPVPRLGRTDTGGQVVYVLEMAKAMSRLGIAVDIFTRWFERDKPQVDPVPGYEQVNVVRIPAGPWEFIPKEQIYDVLPELTDNMTGYIKENDIDYDLFHGHYVDGGIVALDVAGRLGKPSYFTAHSLGAWKRDQMGGDPEKMEKKFNFRHRIDEEMRIFRNVNGQTLTSEVQLEKLNQLYDYDASNIRIIPPGVDIHRFHVPTGEEKRIKTTLPSRYIYCLSRIDTNKGHDLLLTAFDAVRREVDDVDLVIGGGSPNPKEREQEVFGMMEAIIEEMGMKNKVHIIGYVADEMMVTYYQQSLFFVLPSLFEPFGMTTQEAMACGKAVIASKFGGIRNVITHNMSGLLVDVRDPEEFASEMIRLVRDDDFREEIGKAGHTLIREEYSWEAISERFLDFYSEFM